MRAKTLVVLAVLLAVVGAVCALVLQRAGRRSGPSEPLGKLLLQGVAWDKVAAVQITGPKGRVLMEKTETHWGVNEREGYPADLSKLRRLFSELKELKIGRSFPASEEVLGRLKLKPPREGDAKEDGRATQVILKNMDGQVLVNLLLGKVWQGGGDQGFPSGRYVRLGTKGPVYLVDRHFPTIETDPVAWLDKEILSVKERGIKEIRAYSEGGRKLLYSLAKKSQKDDFLPAGPLKGRLLDKGKVNSLARALSNLRLEDVLPLSAKPESVGIDKGRWVEYHLFDGRGYKVFVSRESGEQKGPKGREDSKHYLTFETKDNSGNPSTGPKAGRLFEVSKWAHKSFLLDPQQLLQPNKKSDGKEQSDQGP